MGMDTLMDTNILSDMLDPLMHVLRNAVDHGIETPEQREKLGKPTIGQIDLSFTREGNTIAVRCRDDGSGLDYDMIRQVGELRGFIVPDQPVSDDELNRLILQPGFSTRTETTQVSGRGIGMDAVYNQLLKIKGSINIESTSGKGCLVELRLPVTLISTHALLIRIRQQVFAISDRGVEQILHANSGELHRVGDIITYQMGDDIYEVVYLETLLNFPADRRRIDRGNRPALLVRDETGTVRAVMIEEVLESRDLVVKSMGEYMPDLQGILGATILGDGSVTPVLDIPELLRTPVHSSLFDYEVQQVSDPQELRQNLVLIVDDSLSVRRSMQQLVGDAGFEVRTARDGLEAIELLNTIQPDLLLVDLEMPRMNGLELTNHVRAQTRTQQMPIIMITSRSTQKHRQEAENAGVDLYITKPVADDELLAQINKALHS
jgi:chemosensory pili system protein ChpA (sensor histidine kinase/response regulator)